MKVLDLGRMEYGECLAMQRRLRDQRQRGEGEDTLILVEHPPVATLGRRGTPDQVFDKELPTLVIERGSEATYHGPGQLVLYPIVHLGEGNRDVRAWVQHLETFDIDLLAHFGVQAGLKDGSPGVWILEPTSSALVTPTSTPKQQAGPMPMATATNHPAFGPGGAPLQGP